MIVGARCAGSAAARALALRGRNVVALDGASFPSDTLSTHLFTPGHWAEVLDAGAFAKVVERLAPPRHYTVRIAAGRSEMVGRWPAVRGIDYGGCVRRPGLDLALVDAAREAGAEIRERARVTALVWENGRARGVRWSDREGNEGAIRAKLVIGADGRHSTLAELVGTRAHHIRPNSRMMAFAYYANGPNIVPELVQQWRVGREQANVFPCDGDVSLALFMSPTDLEPAYRSDPAGTFERIVGSVPRMAECLDGSTRETKIRISYKHPSYFRHSAGPGWALAGDAGHFKDPTMAQGIRDGLRFGRLLGEAAAPALDDEVALDKALLAWEDDRDRQCLLAYQFANLLGFADEVSPIEDAAYMWFGREPDRTTAVLAVFARALDYTKLFTPARAGRWIRDAFRDGTVDNRLLGQIVRRDAARELDRQREYHGFFRRREASARQLRASQASHIERQERLRERTSESRPCPALTAPSHSA